MIFNMTGSGGGFSGFPEFEYTGQIAPLIDDGKTSGKQDWRLKLLTSGTLTLKKNHGYLDVFLVGGGGGGGYYDGGGGGGGYTMTGMVQLKANTPYTVEIGAGGDGATSGDVAAADGGVTSIIETATGEIIATINGGKGGGNRPSSGSALGSDGGSGGGAGGADGQKACSGGSDGSDGGDDGWVPERGGKGQGTTTREFGAADGQLYAGGGGGGSGVAVAPGGEGGGGDGGYDNGKLMAQAGETNTGGGGGGGSDANTYKPGAAGGSGIVVIRNHREVTA